MHPAAAQTNDSAATARARARTEDGGGVLVLDEPTAALPAAEVQVLLRSIRNRFPYIDPLNHVQVELLKRHRAGDPDDSVTRGIHLTINGIAAGLRNTG